MRMVCCNNDKSAQTAYEAIVQCTKCKACWHEGCYKVFGGCCDFAVKIVALDSVDFEKINTGQ